MEEQQDQAVTTDLVSAASQPLNVVPTVVAPPASDEVIDMLVEQSRFSASEEVKALAVRLLEAGYTVQRTARKLELRATTVWAWSREPEIQAAISSGRERRKQVLGEELEDAASGALGALITIAGDVQVSPRDRVKAASEILDRCGISPGESGRSEATIAVNIDFDERLAQIVAGSRQK